MDMIKALFIPHPAPKNTLLSSSKFFKNTPTRNQNGCLSSNLALTKLPPHHQRNQHDQIKKWENNAHPPSFGFGNDDDKIHAKAFLSCSQSSAVEEIDWGTFTVGFVVDHGVYGGRERGRRVDTLFAIYFRFFSQMTWHFKFNTFETTLIYNQLTWN